MDYTTLTFGDSKTEVALTPLSTALQFDDSMTDTLELTAGDSYEPIEARLFDPDGDPADLEGARITFRMIDRSGEAVVERRADVDDTKDEAGWAIYEWRRDDLDEDDDGTYRARFLVQYPNGKTMHYPNGRPARILLRKP